MIRPLGDWAPDAPDMVNPGLVVAKGCYPSAEGYAPFWAAETTGVSVSGTVMGAARFERTDGTEILCVGTSSDLYVIASGTANASSLTISSLNASEENWTFEQFGLQVYATIKSVDSDQAQTYYLTNIDTDVAFSQAPGTPPHGNAMARVDDFLVFGDVEDIDDTDQPYRIRWSPFNSPDGTYGTDLATQASFVDMPGHLGPVRAIGGGEIGLILQKNGVSRFDYTGGVTAFQKVVISEKIGCVGQASLAKVAGRFYWLSESGFMTSDGSTVDTISGGRVWDWFLTNANTEKLSKAQAAINGDRRCIVWNFYQVDTTAYNAQIIYNYELNRWSYAFETVDWLVPVTYDGAFSEGDPRQRKIIGGFQSGTLYEYSGAPIEAVLETGEMQVVPGQRSFVSSIRPLLENASTNTKVALKYRNDTGDTKTSTTSTAVGALGFLGVNVDARYFGIEITIPASADWDKAHGVLIDAVPSGVT